MRVQPRLLSVSPSRLGQWLTCPRAYRMIYLDRPRRPQTPQRAIISVGNSVHATLSRFWDLPHAQRTPQEVEALLAQAWQVSGFADVGDSEQWRERASAWVVNYLRSIDRFAEPVAIERTVAMPTGDLAIAGRVDRVEERAGELIVIDYKTGAKAAEEGAARTSLALGLYALALSRMFRRPVRTVELHHLPTGMRDVHTHTDESLARKLAEAESIGVDLRAAHEDFAVAGAESAMFEPVTSALCRWCPVQAHCQPGLAIGPPQPGWAGLDALAAVADASSNGATPPTADGT